MDYFAEFPNFVFDDYIMRELTLEDAEDYFLYMAHPQVAEFIPPAHSVQSVEMARLELAYWSSLFKESRGFFWGIALQSSGTLIGTAGFNSIYFNHQRGEISYDLSYEYWGRGIMSRALRHIIEFADKTLDLMRLQAIVAKSNRRSIQLLKKLSFQQEGILRKYEKAASGYQDSIMYARILG